jgi:hypothetical protein
MTNFKNIKLMSLLEMAEFNVRESVKQWPNHIYDREEDIYFDVYERGYITSDGEFFVTRNYAIDHEIEWLMAEVEK